MKNDSLFFSCTTHIGNCMTALLNNGCQSTLQLDSSGLNVFLHYETSSNSFKVFFLKKPSSDLGAFFEKLLCGFFFANWVAFDPLTLDAKR